MTVVRFSPGLTPVLKHPGHGNQKVHGKKGNGSHKVTGEEISAAFEGEYTTDSGLKFSLVTTHMREESRPPTFDDPNPKKMPVAGGDIVVDGKVVGEWGRGVEGEKMHAIVLTVGKTIDISMEGKGSKTFAPEVVGKGIATAVQKQTEKAAKSLGCTSIAVSAASDGSFAWANEKFGYRFDQEKPFTPRVNPLNGINPDGRYSTARWFKEQVDSGAKSGDVLTIPSYMAVGSGQKQITVGDNGRGYYGEDSRMAVKANRDKISKVLDRFDGPSDQWPTPHEILHIDDSFTYENPLAKGGRITLGEDMLQGGWYGVKPSTHVTKAVDDLFRLEVIGVDEYIVAPAVVKFAPGLTPVLKHPGHGDQKVHGRKGGSAPAGFTKRSNAEMAAHWERVAREDWESPPEQAKKYGKRMADLNDFYDGPNGTVVKVERGNGVTDAHLKPIFEQAANLQKVAPNPGLTVEVSKDAYRRFDAPDEWGGFAEPGKPELYLNPRTVKDGINPGPLMGSAFTKPREYALTHEWGHTVDKRDSTKAAIQHNTALKISDGASETRRPPLSSYGKTDKYESYAESFAEFHLTGGSKSNPVVAYFAEENNWGSGEGSVLKAKDEMITLVGDTFTSAGPGTLTMKRPSPFATFEEEDRKAAVIKFAPGLTPVLKHPGHGDQKVHGRRGGSTTTSSENPHVPAELKSAFQYATGSFDDAGESVRALSALREKAEEHAATAGYSADDAPHGGRMSSADIYTDGIHSMGIDKRMQNTRWKKRTEDEEGLADLKTVHDAVDKWRYEGDVMMKVPSEHLDSILAVGVKNQFDTAESGGLLDNDLRAVNEFTTHGVPPNAKGADRPVYGFIGQPGREHPGSLMQYGDVTLVLKDNARDRTTVTLGDSLNTFSTPVPLKGRLTDRQVSDMTAVSAFSRSSNDYEMVASEGIAALSSGKIFMEAQISGGVSRSDISRIVFARRFHVPSEVASLRESLADEGIEVEVAP